MTALRPGAWRRAAILAVVIGVQLMLAAPVPRVVTAQDLRRESSAREIRAWSKRLSWVGIDLPPAALRRQIRRWTGRVGGAHRALKRPLHPLRRWTGTGQGWALFAVPARHSPRFEIRVRREGQVDSELLFLHLDPEHGWWEQRLVHRRLRGLWNEEGRRRIPSPAYRRFAGWIADRVFEEQPDVQEVTVLQRITHTTLPGEPPDERVEERHRITATRP